MRPEQLRHRGLWLALWGLLIFGFALWRFWPQSEFPEVVPEVEVGKELKGTFLSARVARMAASRYDVVVTLTPEYRERLAHGELKLRLAYQFLGERSLLYKGVAVCVLDARTGSGTGELPNPERVSARLIRLYLAH